MASLKDRFGKSLRYFVQRMTSHPMPTPGGTLEAEVNQEVREQQAKLYAQQNRVNQSQPQYPKNLRIDFNPSKNKVLSQSFSHSARSVEHPYL